MTISEQFEEYMRVTGRRPSSDRRHTVGILLAAATAAFAAATFLAAVSGYHIVSLGISLTG